MIGRNDDSGAVFATGKGISFRIGYAVRNLDVRNEVSGKGAVADARNRMPVQLGGNERPLLVVEIRRDHGRSVLFEPIAIIPALVQNGFFFLLCVGKQRVGNQQNHHNQNERKASLDSLPHGNSSGKHRVL